MGSFLLHSLSLLLILQTCFAPPVTQSRTQDVQPDSDFGGLEDYMEYHRYLKEVVQALESDPEFRKKLDTADEKDIKSGRIAEELQFVSHHVRTRLDELKRVELKRLKELTEKKIKLEQGNDIDQDPTHHHLDQHNPHTFEIEDLKKLISKTTQDLAEADKLRKDEFKAYEMEKEYQKQAKLNHTQGADHEKLEKELKEQEEKHRKHEKLHEPGHKAQLEEVWEEQDQMQQDFDPKTFFMLHDIDSNGLWDQEEVKALFIKELDKMYQEGAPEDDMRERIEEMERMRESVFTEMDTNRDGFIDYMEFLRQTNTNDFKQDHGWQGLDEQTKPYTDEELQRYIQRVEYERQHAGPPQQFHPGQVPQMAPQQLGLDTNEINHGQPQYQQHPYPPQQQQYQQPQYQPPNPNAQYQQQYQQPNQNVPQNQPAYQQPNVPQYQQQNQPQYQQPQYQPPNPQYQQPNVQQPNQQIPSVQYQQPNVQQQPNIQQQPNVQQQQQPNMQQQQQQPNVQQQQPNVQQQQQPVINHE